MAQKEVYYKFDERAFIKLARAYCRTESGWQTSRWICVVLVAIGLLIALGFPMLGPESGSSAQSILFMTGALISLIPFCSAYLLYKHANKKYGEPFDEMRKMFLYSNYSGIQYGYHNRYDYHEPASMKVYQIAYENISEVEMDRASSIVVVRGKIELVEYQDLASHRIRHSYTKGQFGDYANFAFFACFDNQEEFFSLLQQQNVPVKIR